MGFLKENQILRALEKHFAVPGVEVNTFEIEPPVIAMITKEVCEKNMLIPLQKAGTTLVVAFADPSNIIVKEDLRFITRHRIQAVVATESAISSAIEKYYGGSISTKSLNIHVEEWKRILRVPPQKSLIRTARVKMRRS